MFKNFKTLNLIKGSRWEISIYSSVYTNNWALPLNLNYCRVQHTCISEKNRFKVYDIKLAFLCFSACISIWDMEEYENEKT